MAAGLRKPNQRVSLSSFRNCWQECDAAVLAETGRMAITKEKKTELISQFRRDERDSSRAAAPLRPAPEAYLLDTTHLDIDAAFRAAIDIVEAVRAGRTRG